MATIRRMEHLGMVRIAVGVQNLVQLQGACVDDQEAAETHGPERPLSGWQVDPLAVGRDAHPMVLEHVLPAPGQDVVMLRGDDLAAIGVDDGAAGQGYAAEKAAVTRSLRRDE